MRIRGANTGGYIETRLRGTVAALVSGRRHAVVRGHPLLRLGEVRLLPGPDPAAERHGARRRGRAHPVRLGLAAGHLPRPLRRRQLRGGAGGRRYDADRRRALSIWAFSAQPLLVPRSTPFVATAMSLSTLLAARFVLRAYRSRRRRVRPDAERVIIFGAGDAGTQLVRQMRSDKSSPFLPVALIDDDPAKRRLRIHGVRVRGARTQLAEVAAAVRASTVVVALPGADARLLRDVSGRADRAGVQVLVLPPLERIIRGRVVPTDLRAVDVEDLLGRHPARLDLRAITDEIAGKRVLVTGAGGSIGSELCRQIRRFGPASLVMLDRDESALHAVQLSITGRALLDGDDTV